MAEAPAGGQPLVAPPSLLRLDLEPRAAADGAAAELGEQMADESAAAGVEDPADDAYTGKSKSKLKRMFTRKKKDDVGDAGEAGDGVRPDPADAGDTRDDGGAADDQGSSNPMEKSIFQVVQGLGYQADDAMNPSAFASQRKLLVTQRQNDKGRPKLRAVFARELPFYQTHFKDSDKPCVGVAPQKKCRVNPTFAAHMDWSLRAACAATLAAAPSFYPTIARSIDWETCHDSLYECKGWADTNDPSRSPCIGDNMNFMKSVCPYSCRGFAEYDAVYESCNQEMSFAPGDYWVPDLDRSYAAVACILTFGYTIGETTRYFFEFFAGAFAASVVPQIVALTFGASWQATAIFLFLYTVLIVCMPVDNMTKKLTLALCVKYMCTRSLFDYNGWYWTDHWVAYHVAKIGMYGALCALLFQFLIPWRYAHAEAHRCLQSVGSDITISLSHLVQGFCEGQTTQERTKTLRYTDHITRQLMQLEQFCTFAWWEPGCCKPTPQDKTYKYKVCAATMHKCRANLFGMQQALSKWDHEENRQALQEASGVMHAYATAAMKTLDGILHFMVEADLPMHIEDEDALSKGHTNSERLWNIARRKITYREKTEHLIKKHIPAFRALERSMDSVNLVYNDLRGELVHSREDGNRLEEDEQLHLFLMSLTSFGQALLDFPQEYAEMHEARHNESKSDEFIPEAKLVTLFFQRDHFVVAVKTGLAIVLAFLVNAWLFDFAWLAPVAIAYVMAGHQGGSYANTAARGLGVLIGMIISFTLIISTNCDPIYLAIAYFLVILGCSYARVSSPTATYTALVACIVSSQLMVAECTVEMDQQFALARQLVLAVFVMAAAEAFYVPFACTFIAPSNSLYYLRKQVADTLLETRLIFLEIFKTHLSDAWSTIERMAYVANRYSKGDIQEFKPEERVAKIVDNSLWRNLPLYLNSSEVLMQQCWNEPSFWRPPFPKTAYDHLVALNRQSVLFLTVLQNHLSESDRKRAVIAKRGERLLIDDVRKELTELREALIHAMDELTHILRTNVLSEDMRDPAKAPDELRPTGSRHLTPNSNKCKKLLNAMHAFDINSKQELRRRLQNGSLLENAELFAFHSIRVTLHDLAKSIVESDILAWGGDTRWLVALRMEAGNQIQSVNGPIY